MKITSLKFKNIGAYGNNFQEINFDEHGSLNLIVGKNGNGKCVHPDTIIDLAFESEELYNEFLKWKEE